MSAIRSLFDSIDLAMIEDFVEQKQQENLHLDFKTLASPSFTGDDRRNLAKAVSGFGNSDGGVVVWGIDARPDEDGIDAAQELKPTRNVRLAHSRLESLTGESATPIVDGVEHDPIEQSSGVGFLKSYIPASDCGPHMAGLREHRYYKRSGDSFRRMEHFDLEDMFGRRPRPVLSLYTDVRVEGERLAVVVGIRNAGRGVARFPSLRLGVTKPWHFSEYGLDGNYNTGLPMRMRSGGGAEFVHFAGGGDHVVHADDVLEVTRIGLGVGRGSPSRIDPPPPPVDINYRIMAEGVRPIEDQYIIPSDRLVEAIRSAAKPVSPP